ncbi:restriction endonuclease subunit S [Elizabethkingia bruuniana]|uniref:restriction endonuclease subunit S n=1 Tax=Elizabethkingia bruuniana TaxID=1756149 RepID=UPI0012FFCB40|nr:restriction endonuclease subunit S [Elizabethkingia bruuniana]
MINKKLKVGNVPNLRFPEFTEEWETKKLGEVATNVMYGMNAAATNYDGENQYIRITDIDEQTRLFCPNPLSSPDGELDNKYLLHKGDILFARTGASVGKSYLYNDKDGKIYFAGFLIRLNVRAEDPYFIFSQTLTEKYQRWVLTMSMRSGQPGINAEEYKLLPIVIPSIQEQEKISSFLSLIDSRIQTQNKITEEWETKKLGEVATNVMYGMNAAATNYDGENQYIRITDIDEQTRLFCPNPLSSPDGELDNKYLLHKGDILFARTGASVGKSYLYNDKDGKIYFAGFLIRLNVRAEDPYFIFSQTLTEKYQRWVLTMSMRSGQPGINAEEYKLLPIVIPSIQEQEKISSFLSLIDSRIQTQNKIIRRSGKLRSWGK